VQPQAVQPQALTLQQPLPVATSVTVQPAQIPPPPLAAPAVLPAADPAEEARNTTQALQAAAVQLGLVSQQKQVYCSSAVGTIQSQAKYPAPPVLSMTLPGARVSTVSTQRIVPPPPTAPAPTVVLTPKAMPMIPMLPAAATAPPSGQMESDLKVLLELAVSSGNQQAVDALLRQAQQGGMSPERFNSLVQTAQSR